MSTQTSARAEAEAALDQAKKAARRGDVSAAERWTKTAERMAAVAQKLVETPEEEEDAEALREEILGRIRKLVEARQSLEDWQIDYAAWEEERDRARAEGRAPPEPIRPCPGGDAYLMKIASGED